MNTTYADFKDGYDSFEKEEPGPYVFLNDKHYKVIDEVDTKK